MRRELRGKFGWSKESKDPNKFGNSSLLELPPGAGSPITITVKPPLSYLEKPQSESGEFSWIASERPSVVLTVGEGSALRGSFANGIGFQGETYGSKLPDCAQPQLLGAGDDWKNERGGRSEGLMASKPIVTGDTDSYDSESSQRSFSSSKSSDYKSCHSEIEKRRRKKFNDFVEGIADLVPTCRGNKRRLDKLSVLKLAVQHLRLLSQKSSAHGSRDLCGLNIAEEELKYLLERSSSGFLFVVSAENAQIVYMSDQISKLTEHNPTELMGRCLFELAHPSDEKVISDMLVFPPLQANVNAPFADEQLRGTIGSKRSVFLRIRRSKLPQPNVESARKSTPIARPALGNKFVTIHCSGFLKLWESSEKQGGDCAGRDDRSAKLAYFVGVARSVPTEIAGRNDVEAHSVHALARYSSRHSSDAIYLQVDLGVVQISGYLPQDLIGKCEYDFVHEDDVKGLAGTYRSVLEKKQQEKVISDVYRIKSRHGCTISMKTIAFSLFNPFTEELEYVFHENFVMPGVDWSTDRSHDGISAALPSPVKCSDAGSATDDLGWPNVSSRFRKRKLDVENEDGPSRPCWNEDGPSRPRLPGQTCNSVDRGDIDMGSLCSALDQPYDRSQALGSTAASMPAAGVMVGASWATAKTVPLAQAYHRSQPSFSTVEPSVSEFRSSLCDARSHYHDEHGVAPLNSVCSSSGLSSGYSSAEEAVPGWSTGESWTRILHT